MILLSGEVYKQLNKDVLEAGKEYELGGLLLGYRFLCLHYVIAATTSDETDAKTNISFVLDGEKHRMYATEIMKKFRFQPDILGVWHSHTLEINRFSEQDKESNKQLARAIGNCVSMLITLNARTKDINLSACYLTANMKEHRCKVRRGQ